MPCDVLQDVGVPAGLRRLQPESRQRRFPVGIDLGSAAHGRIVRPRLIGMAQPRIGQDERAEPVRVQIGRLGGHIAAEAVADDDDVVVQPRRIADAGDLPGVGRRIVAVAVVRIAHAGEVHGHHPVGVREPRRDEIPPAGMRGSCRE